MWEFATNLQKQSGEGQGTLVHGGGDPNSGGGTIAIVEIYQNTPGSIPSQNTVLAYLNVNNGLIEIPDINEDIVNAVEVNGMTLTPTQFGTIYEIPQIDTNNAS